MVRLIVYCLIGLSFGVVFGFAFFGTGSAIAGGAIGMLIGVTIAVYINRNSSPDDPFLTQTNIENVISAESYKTAGLPSGVQNWILSKIRSILEGWL